MSRDAGAEVDLHGMTLDEALPRVDSFLHAAFRAGRYRVWIVHGKGSGVLRREIDRYLTGHPLVRRHSLADRYHGGDGATEVDLGD
jgi:DNA mismatch repair protein MutS2